MNKRCLMFIALFVGAPLVSVAVSTVQAAEQASYTCLICRADFPAGQIRHHDCGGTLCGGCHARTFTMASGRAGMCPSCQQPLVQDEDAAMRQAIAESMRSYEQEAPARQVAQAEDAALARREEEDLARAMRASRQVGPQKPLRGLLLQMYVKTLDGLKQRAASDRAATQEAPQEFRDRIERERQEAWVRARRRRPDLIGRLSDQEFSELVYAVPVVGVPVRPTVATAAVATDSIDRLEALLLRSSAHDLLVQDQGALQEELLEAVESSTFKASSRMRDLLIRVLQLLTQELFEHKTMKLWRLAVILIEQGSVTLQSQDPQGECAYDAFIKALNFAKQDADTISSCVSKLLQYE